MRIKDHVDSHECVLALEMDEHNIEVVCNTHEQIILTFAKNGKAFPIGNNCFEFIRGGIPSQ